MIWSAKYGSRAAFQAVLPVAFHASMLGSEKKVDGMNTEPGGQ